MLIVDEVQTGFCRTGPVFAVSASGARADFMTMAKGIAGGFPLGAFAMSEDVAARVEPGDHGGTYCGNLLGCAVAHAVLRHLLVEFADDATAAAVAAECRSRRVFVRQTQGNGVRVFPALTITREELVGGLATMREAVGAAGGRDPGHRDRAEGDGEHPCEGAARARARGDGVEPELDGRLARSSAAPDPTGRRQSTFVRISAVTTTARPMR